MKFFKKSLLALLIAGAFIVSAAPAGKHNIKLSLDKKDGLCKKGDKVTLNIQCTVKGKPCNGPIKLTVLHADKKEENQVFDTNPGQFVYTAATAPDVLQFVVTPLNAEKEPFFIGKGKRRRPMTFDIGVAVDPQEFRCGSPEPEDFRKYWDDAKAELAKVPLKELERKELPVSNQSLGKAPNYFAFVIQMPEPKTLEGKFKAWDVKVACVGAPVSGILTMPADAKPKSLPVIVSFHGAPGKSARAAFAENVIRFDVNAHGFENGQPPEYYQNIHKTKLRAYMYRNAYDRSRASAQAYLDMYPSITLILDLHRDAVTDAASSSTVYSSE